MKEDHTIKQQPNCYKKMKQTHWHIWILRCHLSELTHGTYRRRNLRMVDWLIVGSCFRCTTVWHTSKVQTNIIQFNNHVTCRSGFDPLITSWWLNWASALKLTQNMTQHRSQQTRHTTYNREHHTHIHQFSQSTVRPACAWGEVLWQELVPGAFSGVTKEALPASRINFELRENLCTNGSR